MPTYDQDDLAAVTALLTRYERMWYERDRDQKLKEEVEARLAGYPALVEKLRSAFALFGVDDLRSANWLQLRKDIGDETFFAATLKGRMLAQVTDVEVEAEAQVPDDDSLLPFANQEQGASEGEAHKGGTIREIVLERLVAAGKIGIKAADLRKFIEEARGTVLHEKTVGMTLYRLSREGAARREGRTWFFVPEAKNPAGDTAGLINRDTKEGEEP